MTMYMAYADKLINFTEEHAEEIAQQWSKALRSNPRTTSYMKVPEVRLVSQGYALYKTLKKLFFDPKASESACDYFSKFAEEQFCDQIPLDEAIYALIMLRRHLWLLAEFQVLFTTALDHLQAIESINRLVLLTDYGAHEVAKKYRELSASGCSGGQFSQG